MFGVSAGRRSKVSFSQQAQPLSKRRPGQRYAWRSPFANKSKKVQSLCICNPAVFPIISFNLAALRIQKWWQGTRVRRRMRGLMKPRKTTKQPPESRHAVRTYVGYFNETGESHRQPNGNATMRFKHWCARRIQLKWRAVLAQRRAKYHCFPVYQFAALEIQRYYRTYQHLKNSSKRRAAITTAAQAALIIQRMWRAFTSRRIYCYFRDLIVFRQNSDPVTLMRSLNPKEASLVDSSSGVYVRFRLGGASFPPIIYYKLYTSQSVTDICSFAPRDYSRERQTRQKNKLVHTHALLPEEDRTNYLYWYKRWENNGWRPISDKLLVDNDEVVETTAAKKIDFHYSKLVRQVDLLKKRKKKKLAWLKKMYSQQGVITTKHQSQEVKELVQTLNQIDEKTDDVFDKDWEDQADDLLTWSSGLDYEAYQDNWFVKATSRPAHRGYFDDFDSDSEEDAEGMGASGDLASLKKKEQDEDEDFVNLSPTHWEEGVQEGVRQQ